MSRKTTWMLFALFATIAACSKHNDPIPAADPRLPDEKVTADNYMNGAKFCETYKNPKKEEGFRGTAAEFSKRVEVPKIYGSPQEGSFFLYTWTPSPFDPSKPTFVFLDGGPGGNSHGEDGLMDQRFNEIHFDQRGIGCSAPDTYAEYMNYEYFSSDNTIKDMEAIRAAYGIKKWTPYGTSYGTVLATMYAHTYPTAVSTVVLDGTLLVNGTDIGEFRARKLNAVLDKLTDSQKESFRKYMRSNSDASGAISDVYSALYFQNNGFGILLEIFQVSYSNGQFSPNLFQKYADLIKASKNGWGHPQTPMGLDENILIKLNCSELDLHQFYRALPYYSTSLGRFDTVNLEFYRPTVVTDMCKQFKAAVDTPAKTYNAADYPFSNPVVYFQGTDDGATPMAGAVAHWRTVAQGTKTFMLKMRGGHCPNALALFDSKHMDVKSPQMELFAKAILGQPFSGAEISAANAVLPSEQQWRFYSDDLAKNDRPEDQDYGI